MHKFNQIDKNDMFSENDWKQNAHEITNIDQIDKINEHDNVYAINKFDEINEIDEIDKILCLCQYRV